METLITITLLALSVLLITFVLAGLRLLNPGEIGVIVRLGKPVLNVLRSGLVWVIPFGVERLYKFDGRLIELNPPVQGVLTRDGIPIDVDLFYTRQVRNPTLAGLYVRNLDQVILGLVEGMLVNIIGQFSVKQLIERPEIKDQVSSALEQVVAQAERLLGVEVGNFRLQQFRLPKDLEKATTDVRVAAAEQQAAIRRARFEARVTDIERKAQGDYWVEKTWIDALLEMARAGKPPLIIKGTSETQSAINSAVLQTLQEIQSLVAAQQGKQATT